MTKLAILIGACLMAGCASTNPLGASKTEAATLQNHFEEIGDERLTFTFVSLDDHDLKPGAMTRGNEAKYIAPAGHRRLVVRVVRTVDSLVDAQLREAFVPFEATLRAGATYVARGVRKDSVVTAWVEDALSHEIVTAKLPGALMSVRAGGIVPVFISK